MWNLILNSYHSYLHVADLQLSLHLILNLDLKSSWKQVTSRTTQREAKADDYDAADLRSLEEGFKGFLDRLHAIRPLHLLQLYESSPINFTPHHIKSSENHYALRIAV